MRGNPSAARSSLSTIVCLAPHATHRVGRWYGAEGDDEASGWDTDEWQSWDQDAATARFHAGAYVTRGHEEEAQAAATGHEEAQATATGHEEEAKGADGQLKEWPSTVMELTMTECVGARKKICRGSIPEPEKDLTSGKTLKAASKRARLCVISFYAFGFHSTA